MSKVRRPFGRPRRLAHLDSPSANGGSSCSKDSGCPRRVASRTSCKISRSHLATFSAIRLRMIRQVRFRHGMLNTGTLTAHKDIRLVLLHSWPDTVHSALLRKTRVSTHTLPGCCLTRSPSAGYHPCYSGFQVQGAATSPAAQFEYTQGGRKSLVIIFPAAFIFSAYKVLDRHDHKTGSGDHENTDS